jgi:hypothetical protein
MLKLRSIALVTLTICLATTQCGVAAHPVNAVGVSIDDDGVRAHVHLCPGEKVSSIFISDTEDYGEDDILWHVESNRTSEVSAFTLGVLPAGFEQVGPMRAFPIDETFFVHVATDVELFTPVRLQDMETEQLYFDLKPVDQDYLAESRSCS